MKKNNKFPAIMFLCITLCIWACKDKGINKNKSHGKRYAAVILKDNTALRVDPFIFSSKIDMLNKGEMVEISEKSEVKSWIGSTNDYWYMVKLKNGVTGWIYGQNLKMMESKQLTSDNYLTEFWENEAETMRKEISGKWWSQNEAGDFTDHCIEFTDKGSYRSYSKKNLSSVTEGEYNFDFNKNEIVFLNGTSFNGNVVFVKRGGSYFFRAKIDSAMSSFKKIQAQ